MKNAQNETFCVERDAEPLSTRLGRKERKDYKKSGSAHSSTRLLFLPSFILGLYRLKTISVMKSSRGESHPCEKKIQMYAGSVTGSRVSALFERGKVSRVRFKMHENGV